MSTLRFLILLVLGVLVLAGGSTITADLGPTNHRKQL